MNHTFKDENIKTKEMNYDEAEEAKEKVIFTDDDRKMKFYEELRKKVRKYSQEKVGKAGVLSEYLFLLPDLFILLSRLAIDDRVPTRKKLFAGAIIAYVIMPLDIIPDFIPFIGQIDDLVLSVLGLNMILNEIDKQVLIDNWSGQGNVLELLKKITAKAEQFLDRNILRRIKNWINKKA
ncbi:MAG: YkvA family protein [Candidatus Cloacimonadaceae bacterium]